MQKLYSICFVIPYFGKFHNYFQLFLNSCASNNSIDWLVFTDSSQEYHWPSNVKKIQMSFEEFRVCVQKNYEFPISLEKPYKLCDYKPAYGEILASYLTGYDFWGYCDCDMILGDIRKFITPIILDQYDKIFTRGHMSIYRNNIEINSFYRTQTLFDYKKVYSNEINFSFDEWSDVGGVSNAWELLEKEMYDELLMDDIFVGFDGFHPTKQINNVLGPYHKHNKNDSKRYKKMKKIFYEYNEGILNRVFLYEKQLNKEEILYVHFQKRVLEVDAGVKEDMNKFLIIDDRFLQWKNVFNEYSVLDLVNGDTIRNKCLRAKSEIYVLYHKYFKKFLKRDTK